MSVFYGAIDAFYAYGFSTQNIVFPQLKMPDFKFPGDPFESKVTTFHVNLFILDYFVIPLDVFYRTLFLVTWLFLNHTQCTSTVSGNFRKSFISIVHLIYVSP